MTRRSATLLRYGVSATILALLFFQAWRHGQFYELALHPKRWEWLVFSLAAVMTASLLAFTRWWALARALDLPLRWLDAVRLGFLGQMFNLLSFGVLGGDAVKAVVAARRMPLRLPEAVASVVADRGIGLLAMMIVAAVAYFAVDLDQLHGLNAVELEAIRVVCRGAIAAVAVSLSIVVLLWATPRLNKSRLARALARTPLLGRLFERLLAVVQAYRDRPTVPVVALAISLVINVCFAVAIYSIAVGLSLERPSLGEHFVIAPIAMVANAVPLPGGLGGMELAMELLYRGFSRQGLVTQHGFVVALGYRAVLLAVAALGAVVYVTQRHRLPVPVEPVLEQLPNEDTPTRRTSSY